MQPVIHLLCASFQNACGGTSGYATNNPGQVTCTDCQRTEAYTTRAD